jgi:hypothetical protein
MPITHGGNWATSQQFVARNLGLDQRGLAVIINPVHGEDVLGQIDSNCDNAHGLPLSWF